MKPNKSDVPGFGIAIMATHTIEICNEHHWLFYRLHSQRQFYYLQQKDDHPLECC